MTIVVTVRVTDGIVLAADSATSFTDADGHVAKIYNGANKIFNLVKVWPIGAMTYGAGSIGTESISTLSKNTSDTVAIKELVNHLSMQTYICQQCQFKMRAIGAKCD
jgi:hypothetical protein